jgi:hypothetical protein
MGPRFALSFGLPQVLLYLPLTILGHPRFGFERAELLRVPRHDSHLPRPFRNYSEGTGAEDPGWQSSSYVPARPLIRGRMSLGKIGWEDRRGTMRLGSNLVRPADPRGGALPNAAEARV